MARTTNVEHYTGPVEVWVDGAQQFEANVRLTKREVVEVVETLGGTETALAGMTWDGRFQGMAQEGLRTLQAAGEFELRLDTRSVGLAVVLNGRDLAYLQGLGDPPF